MSIASIGKPKSKEARRKMSESKKGHTPWNKNKKGVYSKLAIQKMSEGQKRVGNRPPSRKGAKMSEEAKMKISESRRGDKCFFWKGGISFEPYSLDWTRTLKRSIRERDHYACQICGALQGDRAFDIHHIDYDKKNCNPNNLITLCHSCHIKTNGNRNYWISYFKK